MKLDRNLAIIAIAILALAAVNLLVFSGFFEKPPIYKGVPLLGSNALENLKGMSSLPNVTIIVEGDTGVSQKNSLIAQTAVELASFFGKTRGARGVQVYSLEFENGTAVACQVNKTVDECAGYSPGQGSFLVRVKYPAYPRDEVVVTENTIELHSRDAREALALAYWLEDVMGSVRA